MLLEFRLLYKNAVGVTGSGAHLSSGSGRSLRRRRAKCPLPSQIAAEKTQNSPHTTPSTKLTTKKQITKSATKNTRHKAYHKKIQGTNLTTKKHKAENSPPKKDKAEKPFGMAHPSHFPRTILNSFGVCGVWCLVCGVWCLSPICGGHVIKCLRDKALSKFSREKLTY